MKFKTIHFILNPASGSKEPIISDINTVFCESGIKWDVSVTKKAGDAGKFAKALIGKTELIAVYGGDGSLSEVAGALCGSNTPLAVIPGGTANVIAKELGMPLNTIDALELLKGNSVRIVKIDMGMVNKYPFIIRVNLGIMADMIIKADNSLKNNIGQLAYGVSALQSFVNILPATFKLLIDGKVINENGVALTVTNSGGLGIGSFSLLPGIDMTDGFLDVVLLNDTDIISALKVAGSTLFQTDSDVLKHWRCKEIIIGANNALHYLCDDVEKKAKKLHIHIIPKALKIVVPSTGKI
jgi:diacylglycerol kinase (ATP)